MHYFHDLSAATTALRVLKTQGATRGDAVAAEAFTRHKGWDDRAQIVEGTKASVGDLESGGVGSGFAFNFARAASSASIVSRLPGIRMYRPRMSLMTPNSRIVASVQAEGRAVPVIATGYTRGQIELRAVKALLVASNEAMQDDLVEPALAADLLAACANALDLALLDGTTGSLTDGVTPIDSSVASLAELDLALKGAMDAMSDLGGSLRSAAWVLPAWLAGHLGLIRGTAGSAAYEGIGASGGSLAGLPALVFDDFTGPTSDGAAIVLVDGSLIGLAEGPATLRRSTDATIEMSTTPTGDTITPNAATVMRASMFDSDCVALLATLRTGYLVRRIGAVQTIEGISL